jgi:hypothetical protein
LKGGGKVMKKMNMKLSVVVIVLGLAAWLFSAIAQEGGDQLQGPPPGGRGGKPPAPPIETALDANGDGTIDADEIANASVALKTLDKNGDGKLTSDEYRPSMPRQRADR